MSHVVNVTIDHTKVSADMTDFIVYVNLVDMPAAFWSTVANGGGDIRCYKSDGTTELAREVVSCDTSGETGEIHIKFTGTLSSSVDTVIQIHADGSSSEPAVTATYGRNAVWSDYVAVWHMNESSGTLADSSGKNDLAGGTLPGSGTAKVGNGRDFESSSAQYAAIADASQTGLDFTTALSFAGWLNFETKTADKFVFSKGDVNAGTRDVAYWMFYNGSALEFRTSDDGTLNTGHNVSVASPAWSPTTGTWYHVAFTFDVDTETGVFYVNGSSLGSVTKSGSMGASIRNSTDRFNIGGRETNGGIQSTFDGVLDEVRAYSGIRLSNWTATEYANQNSPSTFYSVTEVGGGYTGAIKSIAGVAQASIKSIAGVAIANIKSMASVSNV
jgi:hypothetical protein